MKKDWGEIRIGNAGAKKGARRLDSTVQGTGETGKVRQRRSSAT